MAAQGTGRAAPAAIAAAIAIACAVGLSGCVSPPQRQVPNCLDLTAEQETFTPELRHRIQQYGLWSQTWANPPGASQLKFPAPVPPGFDPGKRIWITTILLAPGVSGTVTILKPRDAKLYVVSTWERMNPLNAFDLQFGATRSVHLDGCDGVASYPGLTIIDGPECVVFAVQRDGENRVAEVPVSFFGAEC